LINKNKSFFDLKELEFFAKKISKDFKKGSIICLKGELGAGKTTLAKFIINSLYAEKEIPKPFSIKSPSFPILLTYDLLDTEIFHYDLYRISNHSELNELSIEESIENAITIIEWPEILLNNNFNYDYHLIELEIYNENKRIVKMNINNQN